jgi:hypothetical protein
LPYLDNDFVEVARTNQVWFYRIFTFLSDLKPNLAHSSCEWSLVHLLYSTELEKKKKTLITPSKSGLSTKVP